jgi:hypothetical protein
VNLDAAHVVPLRCDDPCLAQGVRGGENIAPLWGENAAMIGRHCMCLSFRRDDRDGSPGSNVCLLTTKLED